MKANRPHYHVLIEARGGRMWYPLKRAWHTRQAAFQWARRNYGKEKGVIVRQCEKTECAPDLDGEGRKG